VCKQASLAQHFRSGNELHAPSTPPCDKQCSDLHAQSNGERCLYVQWATAYAVRHTLRQACCNSSSMSAPLVGDKRRTHTARTHAHAIWTWLFRSYKHMRKTILRGMQDPEASGLVFSGRPFHDSRPETCQTHMPSTSLSVKDDLPWFALLSNTRVMSDLEINSG